MNQEMTEIKESLTLILDKLENLESRIKNLENLENLDEIDNWDEDEVGSLKRELSSLYGYIRVFRSDTIRDQKTNETYLKVLTKEIYAIQKTLDLYPSKNHTYP